MEWKYKQWKHNDTRVISKFLLVPRHIGGEGKWLCYAKIEQRYEGKNWADDGWHDVRFIN